MVVLVFRTVNDFHHTGNLFLHVVPTFFRCIGKSESSLTEHLHLSVTVGSGSGVVNTNHFFMYTQFRQFISGIGVTKVGRFGEEQRPCTYPQPELLLLVRIKGKVVRLRAVTLKETGKRLPGIHHTEITGIMYQLLVSVGRWRGGGYKAVGNIRKQAKELLVGLGTETT